MKQYSLLHLMLCENIQKVHVIDKDHQGEIFQINKEQLVQVTR
jgi:hypothetical protein